MDGATMSRTKLFEAIRPFAPSQKFTVGDVEAIDLLADRFGLSRLNGDRLTVRAMTELVGHEAIVQEAYKDSVSVWTWSVGITAMAGIDVLMYKDNPQPVAKCLAAFVSVVRRRYLPAVVNVFDGHEISEAQLAAALSFHYNTGAIETASWPKLWKAGKIAEAKASFMEWRKPASIIERRQKECALFFSGTWSGDGSALVIPVAKPSYQPSFKGAKRVNIESAIQEAMR